MDCSPPGSSVHGILQPRILGWVALPSPGDLPDPGIEPGSPALQADVYGLSLEAPVITVWTGDCSLGTHFMASLPIVSHLVTHYSCL